MNTKQGSPAFCAATNIVDMVVATIEDRKGLSDAWDSIEDDLQDSICNDWFNDILDELAAL